MASVFYLYILECPLNIMKPQLQNGVTCTLTQSCTGVECCLDMEFIDRSIMFKLDLDPCNHNLLLSIENLVYNISLFNFEWGELLEVIFIFLIILCLIFLSSEPVYTEVFLYRFFHCRR